MHRPTEEGFKQDYYDAINHEDYKPMYIDWTKEEIRIFRRSKNYFKTKRNIEEAEHMVNIMVGRERRRTNLVSYICYVKWLTNNFRCTLKELQSSLKYAKISRLKDYFRILDNIKNGFYAKEVER